MTTVRAAQASANGIRSLQKERDDGEEPAGIPSRQRQNDHVTSARHSLATRSQHETNVVLLPAGLGARLHSSAWRGKERHIFHE